jgi:hypothetical protein
MRAAICTMLLVGALTAGTIAQPQSSQFPVIYYPDAAVASGIQGGILDIERDLIRFRPNSGQLAWVIDLGNVESVVVEPFAGPFRTVSSIVITSLENGRRVRRRIAAVDDLSLNERAMLAGMIRLRVEQFKAARVALRQ